jgi:hypothetical protein
MTSKTQKIYDSVPEYTEKELKEWIKAGLIATDLLVQEKKPELLKYISENRKKLFEHYCDEDLPNYIVLPPTSQLAEAYELYVIDRKTGEIVSTLHQVAKLQLSEKITLSIKAKELSLWEKDIAAAKNFTVEEIENLEEFVAEKGHQRPLSRQEIATCIKEIQKRKNKSKKYRQSGHLVDQNLKYPKPGKEESKIEKAETRKKIEDYGVQVVAEGIRLTEPESKLQHTLAKLLRDNSQNNKYPHEDDYYFGNQTPVPTTYCGREQKAAVIRFKRPDLYKAYLCKETYSGAEAEFIDSLLVQFESKKFLIRYDHVKKVSNGKVTETRTDRIEDFASLIKIVYFYPNLTESEKEKLDKGDTVLREKKEEVILAYHPIFTDQIDTKFVEFPDDTNRRLVIAARGWNRVTIAMRRLMEWCLREISAGRDRVEINEENLIPLLNLEKYAKQKRIKLLNESIEKAIEAIKNMGIIVHAERTNNSNGGKKWKFILNLKYE